MKHIWKIIILASLVLCISTSVVEAGQQITITGSSTVLPIVEKAAKEFKKMHPNIEFDINGGGSSHGVKSAGNGDVSIGMASRDLKEKEKTQWQDIVSTKIGLDGIAVIVSSVVPLKNITSQQVSDIYTGKIANWKALGGSDNPIVLISKEEGRSTLDLFLKYFNLEAQEAGEGENAFMVHREKGTETYSDVHAKLIGPNMQALKEVSTNPCAIAYVSIGTALDAAEKGMHIKLLDLDGVSAKIKTVANGTYPIRRPLNLLTKGPAEGIVKEFVDYLTSESGRQIVFSLEFIPEM
jgi:phosphate transport system substrate-binding protein